MYLLPLSDEEDKTWREKRFGLAIGPVRRFRTARGQLFDYVRRRAEGRPRNRPDRSRSSPAGWSGCSAARTPAESRHRL